VSSIRSPGTVRALRFARSASRLVPGFTFKGPRSVEAPPNLTLNPLNFERERSDRKFLKIIERSRARAKKEGGFQPPNYGAGLVFRNSRVVSKLREFSKRGSVSGGSPITITLTNRSFFRTRSRPTDVAWVRVPESVRSRIIG
jgi:hypothetical protein